MTSTTRRNLGILAALAVLGACGSKEPPLDQYDAVGLIERGMGAYHEGEWQEAIRYLDRFVLEYPTHARTQEARYYLADAHFQDEEYITAAGRFDRLATDFPQGEFADDARFKMCDAYHRISPEPTLDQQYTRAALDHCRTLVIYHPSSEYVDRAQAIIEDMETKLARKILLGGEFYQKRRAYDSALIYYERVLAEYPGTTVAPAALARMIETYDELDYEEEATEARQRLLREYPDSPQARGLGGGASSMAGTSAGDGAAGP